ncbi:MAG: isopentenyl-diphosphate delta-isomerase [Flavobacteriales bacterium]|nr:isopentenyl-diphosphate delta-isomerase [Flavobacteriales bacterium]|tara:strand:- start:884 stop:1402 length:519 start_codon:yes stop_codon:yes gene_type:complete
MEENVIIVDKNDNQIGLMPKLDAHKKGILHRAFSVFVLNNNNEIMLQKRAYNKYHSGGLWTNTCCSHQREGENSIEAGKRRLLEEMGFETELKIITSFIYKVEFENGLTEHELDYLLIGKFLKSPVINKQEVADWKWMKIELIADDIKLNPNNYTSWFKIIFDKFQNKIKIK